jgi:TldD protein
MMLSLLASLAMAAPADGETATPPVIEAAGRELARGLGLELQDQPAPYIISYDITEAKRATAYAEFGALTDSIETHQRRARVEVRVGDATFDNTNFNGSIGSGNGIVIRGLPTEDNEVAIRRELWLATDAAYKGAAEEYSGKVAALEGRAQEGGEDILPAKPLVTTARSIPEVDLDLMNRIAKFLTAPYSDPGRYESVSIVTSHAEGMHHLITTEGTAAQLPVGRAVVRAEVLARAEDGALLRNCRWWVVKDPSQLPSLEEMQDELDEMTGWVEETKTAPVESDYLGPVIFEPAAAVELFRQLVPAEISANPPEIEPPGSNGEAPVPVATSRVGRRLLPENWTIEDNPRRDPDLVGYYRHDHEGVAGERVETVRDGVVRELLMSRIPRQGQSASTGHGRSIGRDRRIPVPSITEVRPPRNRSMHSLKRKGKRLSRQAGNDYVIVIRLITPLALNDDFEIAFSGDGPLAGLTSPLEAYRLYPSGREEPVRGIKFVGVDRRVMRDIVRAGPQSGWINLTDDAPGSGRHSLGEIGGLGMSWSAPAVLISEMELRGQGGRESRVLPPPSLPASGEPERRKRKSGD